MIATSNLRILSKLMVAAACVALLSLPAVQASAQTAPPNYQLTWISCDDTTDSSTGDETVAATFMYTVPTTSEMFYVSLLMTNSSRGISSLSADYYDPSGSIVATVMVNDDVGAYRITDTARSASQDASLSFVEVLKTYEFQSYLLDGCLAKKCKPWVHKLIKGLCYVATGACCGLVLPACPACLEGGKACQEAADDYCNGK